MSRIADATLGQDQFLQLLVAQLQNQDPLDPVSDRDFIAQLATFSQLQQTTQLNASFSQMLALQQLSQGADLIGRTVEYTPTAGGEVRTGAVSAVTLQDGQYVLAVGSDQIPLDLVRTVRA